MSSQPSSKDGDLEKVTRMFSTLFLYFDNTMYKVWLQSIIQFKRQQVETQFWSKLKISKYWGDLEIR